MKIEIFDSELNRKAIVFVWKSLLWQPKYNDKGSFQIEFQQSSGMLGVIHIGDYIVFDEDNSETVMLVDSIRSADKSFVVSGSSAVYSILSRRISTEVIVNESAEVAMRRLVENMSFWDNLVLGNLNEIGDKYTAQISDGSVWDYCFGISQATDIGIRIRKEQKSLLFECYKPPLNTAVRFAANLGNMGGERFAESDLNYYNVATVAGAGEGELRITVTAGDTSVTGINRREVYIDARNESPEENETEEEYMARLVRYGENKLSEFKIVKNICFDISDELVSLGDKVVVTPSYSNEVFEARITSLTIKSQNNITTRQIGIGTPVATRRRS